MSRILAAIDLRDVCAVVGYGLVVYGVSLLSREAAFIVAGGLLLLAAIVAARA